MTFFDEGADAKGDGADDAPDHVVAERLGGAGLGLAGRGGQSRIERPGQRHDAEPAVGSSIGLGDLPRQALAHLLGQVVDVLGPAGVHGQCFQDRFQVADADPFAEQVLQDALEFAGAEQPGHDLADQGRCRGTDPVEQSLDLFAGQELVGMGGDDLAEVAGERPPKLRSPGSRPAQRLRGHRRESRPPVCPVTGSTPSRPSGRVTSPAGGTASSRPA